ncbi:unnamed protein product [Victoria cruziana]
MAQSLPKAFCGDLRSPA